MESKRILFVAQMKSLTFFEQIDHDNRLDGGVLGCDIVF